MEDLFLDPLPHTWTTPVPDHENETESSKIQSTLEESSIDLYDDLSMSSVRCDLSQGSPEKKVGLDFNKLISSGTKQHISNTLPVAVSFTSKDSSFNLDLYTDHLVAELELKQKLEASESHNSKLNSELKQLATQNDQLRKNISSLFLTAKQEIQDKDLLIADLRAQLERQVSKAYQISTKERKEMEKQSKYENRSVEVIQDKKQYWDYNKKGEENSRSKNDNSPRLLNAHHSAQRRRNSLSKSKESDSQSNRGRFNSSKKNDSDSRKDRAIDETRHNVEKKKEQLSNNKEFILCSDKKGDGFSKSKATYNQKERDKEGSSKRGYDYKHTYKKVESFTKRDKTFSTIDKKNSILHDKDEFSDVTNLFKKEEKRKESPANRGINDISDRIRKLPVKCSTSKFLSSYEEKSTEPRSGLSQKDSRNTAEKAFKEEAKYNCKTIEKDSSSKGPLDLRHKLKRKYESEKYPRQREENEPKKLKVDSSQCEGISSSFATSTIRHTKEQYIAKTTKLTQNSPSTAKDASKDKCQLKSKVIQESNEIGQQAMYGEEKSKDATLGDENSNAKSQYDIGNEQLQTNIVPVTEVIKQNSSKPVSESLKSNESSLLKEAVLSCEKPLFNAHDTESKVKQHVHRNNETSEHTFSFNIAKGKDIPPENSIEIKTSHSFSPIVAPSTEADKMRPVLSAEPDLCKKPIFVTPEMSNQESNSTASILSLPFANIKSVDANSVLNLNSTNQTWPFEISESEQKNEANGIQLSADFSNQTKPFDCISNPSLTKDLLNSNSNNKALPFDTASSVQYSNIDHFKNKSSEQNELKKESLLCKNVLDVADFCEADEVRAFPVSSSPKSHESEPDFTCKSLKCESEENSGDSSRSSAKSSTDSKDSTVVKSGSGKCSSKSSDGDSSSRSSSTDSGSSSAMSISGSVNTGSVHPLSNAITPQNEDQSKKLNSNISAESSRTCDKGKNEEECDSEKSTSDDSINCYEHQKTPFKRKEANLGETGIICTSNLIMLGDEETTCTTFASPSKPLSQPSEFYPPGVRGKIHEGGSHHRHIRGDSKVVFQPINATLDVPTSNSETSSEKSNSRDSGIIFEKFEDLTFCSQKVLEQRSESKKRQFDQSSNFMCESMEVSFDKAESTEVSSIMQKNLAVTSDDKGATFFSDEIIKPELVTEKHKNESTVKNTPVFNSVSENSLDPKAMSSTIQGITSSHSNGPICITTEQDSLVPSLLSPTLISKEAAYASEVGSDQKQSFEAWRNIVEQTYLNVFQQELQTFKNKLLDEALHSGDTSTPEHMNKELKKLQCAVHEYIRSSRPTVSISSSKEENKNIAEISSNKFIARQKSPLQRSSGATFTQHSNTSVSKSDPQDQCHRTSCVKNIAQINQGPASGYELDYDSFVSEKEMKTAKKRLFDQNSKCSKSDSTRLDYQDTANDNDLTAKLQVSTKKNITQCIWGESPDCCIVTSSDSKKKTTPNSPKAGKRITPDTLVHREPDSTSGNHPADSASKIKLPAVGRISVQENTPSIVMGNSPQNLSEDEVSSEESFTIQETDNNLSTEHLASPVKASTPTSTVKSLPISHNSSNSSHFIDENSQFPSPSRLMFNSKKDRGTFHEKDTTFTIYPNLDHVSDQSDGEAETTLVNTSNSDQDRGRNNNSLFTCDELSLCGASLSEFDKDVVQSSPKPESHFEECSTNSSNTKSVHKGKCGKILEGIFQEILAPSEPIAGQSCESLTVHQGTNMSEMDINIKCTDSKIYGAEEISSKNSKGISKISPAVGCNNQHAEDKTSKLLPATQSQECEEIWVDEPESGIEPLEFTSKHLSYQELQELGLVKTCFEITEQSSPINVLESTANETDDSIASPQLSQEDLQFLENVNRVKKNLNMELGKDSSEAVINNKSINDIFSPSSVTTLSSDLYLSDSTSENAPSPVKKAKTIVHKRQQQAGKSLSKEIQLNEASQRVSHVSIKCDSPSVSRSVDLANVQFLDKNLLESDVKSSQVKLPEPLRSEDQDQELEEGEIDDVDECKDDSSATSLNAKSNLAYTEEDMPSRSHHQETYRPKYKTPFSVKRQKTNKHLESVCSGLGHRVSPLERVYNGQTINESTSKKTDLVFVKGKDNPSVFSTSKGETNLNKSDKDKISRRLEDDFAHRHSRKSAQSYDLKGRIDTQPQGRSQWAAGRLDRKFGDRKSSRQSREESKKYSFDDDNRSSCDSEKLRFRNSDQNQPGSRNSQDKKSSTRSSSERGRPKAKNSKDTQRPSSRNSSKGR